MAVATCAVIKSRNMRYSGSSAILELTPTISTPAGRSETVERIGRTTALFGGSAQGPAGTSGNTAESAGTIWTLFVSMARASGQGLDASGRSSASSAGPADAAEIPNSQTRRSRLLPGSSKYSRANGTSFGCSISVSAASAQLQSIV